MTIKRVFGAFWWGALAALFLSTGAVAQTSMVLTGPPPGNTYDGIYVSPYYATVGGSTNVPVICDDFGDDTSIGDHWTATPSAFPTSTGPIGTSWGLAGGTLKQYDAVAWLGLAILSLPSSVQPANALTQQVIDSFALWAVFDPTGVANYLNSNPLSTNAALCTDIFGSAGCTSAWVATDGGLLASALLPQFPAAGTAWKSFRPIPEVPYAKPGRMCVRLRSLSRWFPRVERLSPTSSWQAFAASAPSIRGLGGKLPVWSPPNEVGLPPKSRIKGVPNQARLFLFRGSTLRFA